MSEKKRLNFFSLTSSGLVKLSPHSCVLGPETSDKAGRCCCAATPLRHGDALGIDCCCHVQTDTTRSGGEAGCGEKHNPIEFFLFVELGLGLWRDSDDRGRGLRSFFSYRVRNEVSWEGRKES